MASRPHLFRKRVPQVARSAGKDGEEWMKHEDSNVSKDGSRQKGI